MTAPKSLPPLTMPSSGVAATLNNVAGGARRTPNLSVLTAAGESDIRQVMATASVMAKNPLSSSVDLADSDNDGAMIRLKYAEVGFNPYQPRLYVNESYEDIRTAMTANGMDVALQVTRRGPGQPYFLAGGGNSRLGIAQDIFRDEHDQRFEYGFFMFKKWPGDRRVMASALAENLARSDLKFWEIARAAGEIIDDLEKEHGVISDRRAEELLPLEGIHAKRALIGRWMFTRKRLGALDKALKELTGQQVLSKYQPRLNALGRLAVKFGLEIEAYWSSIVTPTLARASEEFQRDPRSYDADRICDEGEAAFAVCVGDSAANVKRMLQVLSKVDGNVTLEELKVPSTPAQAPAQIPASAAAGDATNDGAIEHKHLADTAGVPREAMRSVRPLGGGPAAAPTADDTAASDVDLTSVQVEQASQTATAFNRLIPHDTDDVRSRLAFELAYLVERVGISDCYVSCSSMPFGFFMEYPAPGALAAPAGQQSAADLLERAQAGAVFWTLQKLSGQLAPNLAEKLPQTSRFYQSLINDDFSLASLSGTLIGDSAIDDVLLLATRPGTDAMTQLLQVVVLMRTVSERYPGPTEGP